MKPSSTLPAARWAAAAGTLAAILALGACGSGADEGSGSSTGSSGSSAISVVASTNVWGSVASAVGGDAVQVTSLISEPSQDPHSFEASSNTLLSVSKADLVIENGGGYDDFMDRMVEAGKSKAPVLRAVDISGRTAPAGGELNEHVWYDLPTVHKVADAIADRLGEERPGQAARFTARARAFTAELDTLVTMQARLRRQVSGERIGITEPVPLYLTDAVGLVDATPAEFSAAVEEGEDVSPAVLQETLDLFTEKKVVALVYNEQTSGPVTEKVKAAAEQAGLPVVPVTETLPATMDYVTWMRRTLTDLRAAVTPR